ncbi:uncharacterized protein LOC133730203 [Rosa rugosa]|uniref:uncharacterized protein LOC133730203 n=1 Tax=Rosa rugosa TaxID=74645 RepID=UPI002B401A04|nr:uncharacterized protein LOC133730203 [Rosa rugosa]
MPGLDRSIVEHRLPIQSNCKPYKQPPRRCAAEVLPKIKEEMERLLKAGFIRTARYVEWLSNIVPVRKKNGKMRICVDFRNLNLATPKDEYPMPVADLLVDGAAKHEILSFMDGHAGYNQIFIAEEDVHKTAFRCPSAIGTFEWLVMPFGLKNAEATYQRAMNMIFHDLIGHTVKVYIDDIVVKSAKTQNHLADLRQTFVRMRAHKLKMNPDKCLFGVSTGMFLGFVVHKKGIEIDKNKAKAIMDAPAPSTKKELQSFLGKVYFLRRFISNSAGKIQPFSSLLRIKAEDEFVWKPEHQAAFDLLKQYLSNPPVLVPPVRGRPLKLYISASENSIGSLLAQDNDNGKECVVHYLSRILTDVETRYTPIERLCLALFFSAIRLRHYMLPSVVQVISKTNLVKYMLTRPIIRGQIGQWTMALSEFTFQYVSQKSVKGQALADFLAHHPSTEFEGAEEVDIGMVYVASMTNNYWTMYFDGSSTEFSAGAGVVVETPEGQKFQFAFQLDFTCTNNQAEYEALIVGLEILQELGARRVLVFGDSQLVINQMNKEFKCTSWGLLSYHALADQLANTFDRISFAQLPRGQNWEANEMAQLASGLRIPEGDNSRVIKIAKRTLPALEERGVSDDVFVIDIEPDDWRLPIIKFHKNPQGNDDRKTRYLAGHFIIYKEAVYRKSSDDLLLLCIGGQETLEVMRDVHEGICGAHQAGIKMRWLIRRHRFYWPTILKDCIEFAKSCKKCQIHAPVQRVPADVLHPIVKPWPFRGWAMDIIGSIRPPSSKQHVWILVATDYFTKWVEAKPYVTISSQTVIKFVEENIIHRFGIPETITADRGSVFIAEAMHELTDSLGIKLTHSAPYYAQANGQAEASNKGIINILKKMVQENPIDWHNLLSETLWAFRTSKRTATGTTPFALTYGHDAMLPVEVKLKSLRFAAQNEMVADDYTQAMIQELEELDQERMDAYNRMEAQKKAVARAYNKRVKSKSFAEEDLVWKAVLPIGTKDRRFGKWSPRWEGPFIIDQVLGKGAYQLRDQDGELHAMPINGQFLKKYYPTSWEMMEQELKCTT